MKRHFYFSILLSLISIHASSQIFDWAVGLGSDVQDEGRAVAVDAAGNVYTTGTFRNTVDFNPDDEIFELTSAGGSDIFIQKSDPEGNFIWAIQMGGSDWDDSRAIAVDASGFIYVTGNYLGIADFDPDASSNYDMTSAGSVDIFVAKLTESGALVWAKSMGGTANDEAHAVATDSEGNVILGGRFQGTADFDPNGNSYNLVAFGNSDDFFLSKMDSDGNLLWAVATGSSGNDHCIGVTTDISGNVIATGYFAFTTDFDTGSEEFLLTPVGAIDIYILKLDGAGNFVWVKSFGSIAWEVGYAVTADESGAIYATGRFEGVVDFDPGSGVHEISALGEQDIYLMKLDADGNYGWAHGFGSSLAEWGQSIALDNQENVYFTGFFQGTIDFNPTADVSNLTSVGGEDIFVCKFDSNGNHLWSQAMGGTDQLFGDRGQSIAVDADANVYTVGWYYQSADFDPGNTTYNLVSNGNFDAFIHKFSAIPMSVNNASIEHGPVCFPNPTDGVVSVFLSSSYTDVQVMISNASGNIVYANKFGTIQKFRVELDGSPGFYFVEIVTGSGQHMNFKILKG